jgi:hypothetical protein
MTNRPPTCIGPSHDPRKPCGRPAVARVRLASTDDEPLPLCATHYQQQRRGRPLRPVGGTGPRVRLPGMLVSPGCAAALEHAGPTLYAAAVTVPERWAMRRPKVAPPPSAKRHRAK